MGTGGHYVKAAPSSVSLGLVSSLRTLLYVCLRNRGRLSVPVQSPLTWQTLFSTLTRPPRSPSVPASARVFPFSVVNLTNVSVKRTSVAVSLFSEQVLVFRITLPASSVVFIVTLMGGQTMSVNAVVTNIALKMTLATTLLRSRADLLILDTIPCSMSLQ